MSLNLQNMLLTPIPIKQLIYHFYNVSSNHYQKYRHSLIFAYLRYKFLKYSTNFWPYSHDSIWRHKFHFPEIKNEVYIASELLSYHAFSTDDFRTSTI